MNDTATVQAPIDLNAEIADVGLYLGQVCRIAGISKMQLSYWTTKARIPTAGNKQRIYHRQALEMVVLIKRGVDSGLQLAAAIEAARVAVN
jgi:DNA-binding transcriptional MerR regulator